MAAKGMEFPWRWTSGTISTNLDVIWGMSGKLTAVLTGWVPFSSISILGADLHDHFDHGGKGDGVPLAVDQWYDFHEF